MKKFFVVVVVLLFSATIAFADQKEKVHTLCAAWSEHAGVIMESRQMGIPMAPVIEYIRDKYGGNQDVLNVYEMMVQKAYATPILEDPHEVYRITSEFQTEIYRGCRITLENELNLYQ